MDAWRDKVSGELCERKGFRRGHHIDHIGSLQLLHSSHVRERDKALLRARGVWNGFFWARFCGGPDGDGHLFWECTFPPLVFNS